MSLLFEAIEPMTQIATRFIRHDEDGVDRLNHKISSFVFFLLAAVVTTHQYVGDVIKCLAPAEYVDSWVEYTNSMCWISNTYFVPMEEHNILEAPRHVIVYYQWVPLVLLLQGVLFYIPGFIWFVYNRSTGFDINKIVNSLRQIEIVNPENRDKAIKYLVKHIDRTLQCTRNMPGGNCKGCKRCLSRVGMIFGRRYGNYMTIAYFFMKLMHIGNMIGQLHMLNIFLDTEYTFYGFEALRDLGRNGHMLESEKFPRVTLCDFLVRKLGRDARVTVQCTLPINLFNEKIFTFVWFYLVFLFVANILSLLSWISTLFPQTRVSYVKGYLKVFDRYDRHREGDKFKLMAFCDKYLKMDGYLALRMISINTNEVATGELISALWDNFIRQYDVGKYHKSSSASLPTTV